MLPTYCGHQMSAPFETTFSRNRPNRYRLLHIPKIIDNIEMITMIPLSCPNLNGGGGIKGADSGGEAGSKARCKVVVVKVV